MMVKSWWCVRCESLYWKVDPEVVQVIQVNCQHVLFHTQLWIVSKWLKVQVKVNLSQQYQTGGDELLFSVGCLCYKLMLASRCTGLILSDGGISYPGMPAGTFPKSVLLCIHLGNRLIGNIWKGSFKRRRWLDKLVYHIQSRSIRFLLVEPGHSSSRPPVGEKGNTRQMSLLSGELQSPPPCLTKLLPKPIKS